MGCTHAQERPMGDLPRGENTAAATAAAANQSPYHTTDDLSQPSTSRSATHPERFTSRQLRLLRQTWGYFQREQEQQDVAVVLFVKLFLRKPASLQLFPYNNIRGEELIDTPLFQRQALSILRAIDFILTNLDSWEQVLKPELHKLARKYTRINRFREQFFAGFIENFVGAIKDILGARCCQEAREAWEELGRAVRDTMTEGYREAVAPKIPTQPSLVHEVRKESKDAGSEGQNESMKASSSRIVGNSANQMTSLNTRNSLICDDRCRKNTTERMDSTVGFDTSNTDDRSAMAENCSAIPDIDDGCRKSPDERIDSREPSTSNTDSRHMPPETVPAVKYLENDVRENVSSPTDSTVGLDRSNTDDIGCCTNTDEGMDDAKAGTSNTDQRPTIPATMSGILEPENEFHKNTDEQMDHAKKSDTLNIHNDVSSHTTCVPLDKSSGKDTSLASC